MTVLFFIAAFLSLGVMFWPYMIPYSITVAQRGGAGRPHCDFCSTAVWWSCLSSPSTRSASTGSFAARCARATAGGPELTSPKQCKQRRVAVGT